MEANGRLMIFNKENIVQFFKDDESLKQAPADALKLLVEKYPYSGVLQLLYCKYLYLHNDVLFEEQLEKCSLVVSDRKKVYELLFQEKVLQEIKEQQEKIEKVTETKEVTVEEVSENKETVEEEKGIKEPQKEKKEEQLPQKKEQVSIEELEQNILAEAINASLQIDISEYAEENKAIEVKAEEEDELEEESKARTFVHWFDKPQKKKSKTKESLVDDFLNNVKKEKVKPKNVFSPTNMAKMSLVAKNEFVTETLADIYAKQGQIDKAIEIYKQLSLKNPEKKTFFASRIRFLKEKQQYK